MAGNNEIFFFSDFYEKIKDSKLDPLIGIIPDNYLARIKHGDFAQWKQALDGLPNIQPVSVDIESAVRVGEIEQCSDNERTLLKQLLLNLQPWRKGPFNLFGMDIDTEWRSDWKWDRIKNHIAPLTNRTVLDVGCGNGYHCWRMAGAGARLVVGVDPHLLFSMQYWAIRTYLKESPVYVLPIALEALPQRLEGFDTVFSMGVLYHRRSPIDHLYALKDCLRKGGELVLETLVIDGQDGLSLVPQERYSRMPNVWFLPTCATLEGWLKKAGFNNVRLVDVSVTTVEEQRSTEWMQFESLVDALDPNNQSLTIEGHPSPKRATFLAEK